MSGPTSLTSIWRRLERVDALGTEYRSFDDLPLTLRVEDLMPILGIGRNTAYELVRSGQIKSIKIGRQIRISKSEVMAFLRQASNCS